MSSWDVNGGCQGWTLEYRGSHRRGVAVHSVSQSRSGFVGFRTVLASALPTFENQT